jgi:hypothetical protein
MPGSWLRLLAILLFTLTSALLTPPMVMSQSDRLTPSADIRLPNFTPPSPVRNLRPPSPDQPIVPPRVLPIRPNPTGFPNIVHAAGTIFSGTVTSISHRPATHGQAIETVAITFHVEQAIRGSASGEKLTISQWMGAWTSGQRYRVGERVLLFLYPPSKLGLTSTIGGGLGRFAVDPAGHVLLTAQHLSAFRKDPVLGGKSRVEIGDFAEAVRRATEEEESIP